MKYKLFTLYPALFALLTTVLLTATSCTDKEDNTPSMADKDRMEELIDKNIEKIVQFRDNYGTYILYNFDQNLDFAYQFEQASNWTNAKLTRIDGNQAAVAVDALYADLFSCYADDYKKSLFPRKILLVDDITTSNELGLSQPEQGHHTAVANINSVTLAGMGSTLTADGGSPAIKVAALKEMHRAFLTDYLVKARGVFPVDEAYLSISQNDYSALMNANRKNAAQLVKEDPDFFFNHGFFFPEEDESTYFPSAEDDIVAFIRNMITMDQALADKLMAMPLMASKMHLITVGLDAMGIDVKRINPCAEQFINMEYVQPIVMTVPNVITSDGNATLTATIIRGSHNLDRLVVSLNGTEIQTVDMRGNEKMRIQYDIVLNNLEKGANEVTVSLYEIGMEGAAATVNAIATYANMENIVGMMMRSDNGDEVTECKLKISNGSGSPVDDESNPNLTTINFENNRWIVGRENEPTYGHRAWKIYKENGMVVRIQEYKFTFIDIYTQPTWDLAQTYEFSYNNASQLQKVTLTPVGGSKQTIVSNVSYANGNIASYSYLGTVYEPLYATANGLTTRIDCLDPDMSGHCFSFTGTEPVNRKYHIDGLPAVIPGTVADIPLQLLYSEYFFTGIDNVWTSGWYTETSSGTMAVKTDFTLNSKQWQLTLRL